MSDKLPSQAQFWGIREPELRILQVVTHWFNGKPLKIRGEKRRIATHHDLPLEELFRATDWNYERGYRRRGRLRSLGSCGRR